MERTFWNRTRGFFEDIFFLAIVKRMNPLKALDREFCASFRQFAKVMITDIKVLVDVGAHDGSFSKRAAKIFPLTKVVMVEPLVEKANLLKKIDLPGLIVYNAALSNVEGMADFNVNECLQASSLLSINPTVASQYNIGNVNERSKINVSVRRLDKVMDDIGIDKIDFLKLDTQGSELKVLQGSSSRLKDIRLVQLELLFERTYVDAPLFFEVNDFLVSNGFVLNRLFDFTYGNDGRILQCDGWYVNIN